MTLREPDPQTLGDDSPLRVYPPVKGLQPKACHRSVDAPDDRRDPDPGLEPAVEPAAGVTGIPRTLDSRITVSGKFLWEGSEKFIVRGVTYGPFGPDADGEVYGTRQAVALDFADMVASGINTIRTYTVPPRWLLDEAWQRGLRVFVGIPWEQHVAFLDNRALARSIEAHIAASARALAGHPAVVAIAIGNEIPASIVRWLGPERVVAFLRRLYVRVKEVDPALLVTYVNYPTTEYLDLGFLDLYCWNVYLEREEALSAYLSRLHNLAADRPLLLGEIGLDSRRHGLQEQARTLEWQLRRAYAQGVAGTFVFSWTDRWVRGGSEIEDWDFGLTDRARQPKPALESVRRVYREPPFPSGIRWPRVSVVVCSCNGSATIRDTLEHMGRLDYPDFEVIVIDDGSGDATASIAARYPVRLVSTPNRGLSAVRNLGMQEATGEIVAYIDDDAYPDPDWLTHLSWALVHGSHAGVGGPNLPPPGDGPIAEAVSRAPGGPCHVLVSDTEAEHIPGCNMAFWKRDLFAVSGFDPVFRSAGDDVDLCWRLLESGRTLCFSPAAVVWHHRRNSLRAYWKQQIGYGRAEALLERKWPERYNVAGHVAWTGRIYGVELTEALFRRRNLVYHGEWGTAPFQSMYQQGPTTLGSVTLMPEWLLIVVILGLVSLVGVLWSPAAAVSPLFGLALCATLLQAWRSTKDPRWSPRKDWLEGLRLRALTALLHLVQPGARLYGRTLHGLTP